MMKRILLVCCIVFAGAQSAWPDTPITYQKISRSPKLEGVLDKIHKDWVSQKPALANKTLSGYGATKPTVSTVEVVLVPDLGQMSNTINISQVNNLGGREVSRSRSLLKVAIPVSNLDGLTQVDGVHFVRLPRRPISNAVVSEGVASIKANNLTSKGFTGRGVKVGVIDLGFEGVPDLQARGELPFLQYTDFTGEGIFTNSVHGSACAEIVHDIAPLAELYLYKVNSLQDIENAKDLALETGVDIVTVSLGFSGGGFGDGIGPACDIVDDAFQNNMLWINAAGNYAQQQYSGLASDPDNDGYHNFDVVNEILELQRVQKGDVISAWLIWNDWPVTTSDYDLILVRMNSDGSNTPVEVADTKQYQTEPQEHLVYEVPDDGRYGFVVWKALDAKTTILKLLSNNHDLESSVSITGTISTPGDAKGALTVGALDYQNWLQGPVEEFSARGPTFDGRIKPDLVAPDNVATISYAPRGYTGTSAATPHVAGAAALLKSSDPIRFTASNLYNALVSSTIDMGDPGKDNVYGAGRLELALLPVGTPALAFSTQTLSYGTVTLGTSKSLDLGLVNSGGASLVIQQILAPSNFSLSTPSLTLPPNRSTQVVVTFMPDRVGNQSGQLELVTNIPTQPRVSVRLNATAAVQPAPPAPRLSLDTSAYSFGSVNVGDEDVGVWIINNLGDATLNISNITSGDVQVAITPTTLSIPAKERRGFRALFRPIRAGRLSSQITLTSNDTDSPVVTIPLSGQGVEVKPAYAIVLQTALQEDGGGYVVDDTGVIPIGIYGENTQASVGFLANLMFDNTATEFEGFTVGDDIPNGQLPGQVKVSGQNRVEVVAASLGGSITKANAHLGTATFKLKPGVDAGQIHLQNTRIRRNGRFEVFNTDQVLRFSRMQETGLPTDFDKDGSVGFGDFLAFAGHFGARLGDGNYDSLFDLDQSGDIGFTDFIIFAADFGTSS